MEPKATQTTVAATLITMELVKASTTRHASGSMG